MTVDIHSRLLGEQRRPRRCGPPTHDLLPACRAVRVLNTTAGTFITCCSALFWVAQARAARPCCAFPPASRSVCNLPSHSAYSRIRDL